MRYVAVAFFGVLFAWPSWVEAAGNAYTVDDAAIGKPGSCHVETWASFASNRDFVGTISPACVVSIALPVEFTALVQRTRTDEGWATIGGLQVKAVPIDTDRIAVAWAFGAAKDFTLQRDLAFANFPTTFKFNKDFRIHTNVGFLHDGRVNVNYGTGGVGFDWDFAPRLSLMGEVFIQAGRRIDPRTVTEPRAQLGLRFMPISTVDVDLIYGQNVIGGGAHWVTLGLTVRSQ